MRINKHALYINKKNSFETINFFLQIHGTLWDKKKVSRKYENFCGNTWTTLGHFNKKNFSEL